jgi:hypothetical protein
MLYIATSTLRTTTRLSRPIGSPRDIAEPSMVLNDRLLGAVQFSRQRVRFFPQIPFAADFLRY